MKKNILKKIIKEVIIEYNKETGIPLEEYKAKPTQAYDDFNETDVEISKKFYNFIISLSKKELCFISTYNTMLRFSYNLPNGDIIEIEVSKNIGFTIQTHRLVTFASSTISSSTPAFGGNIKFKDTEMYDKIFPVIDTIRKQRIVETFNDRIDDLFISCGLSRENNLDELLNDENNEAEC